MHSRQQTSNLDLSQVATVKVLCYRDLDLFSNFDKKASCFVLALAVAPLTTLIAEKDNKIYF